MEREHWKRLMEAIRVVDADWREPRRYEHRTALIVRVYLWAAIHNCAVSWACDRRNWWPGVGCPKSLPDQSTMSRRTRDLPRGPRHGEVFEAFLHAVARQLCAMDPGASSLPPCLCKRIDSKSLPVAAHSKDRDAAWGRGAGQECNGYALHTLWAGDSPMPAQWALTALDVDGRVMARRMIGRMPGGNEGQGGYLAADSLYDASDLHDRCAARNHQLLAPRRRSTRGKGLGHCYQSRHRIRAIDLLEPPGKINPFGPSLLRQRVQIERDYGNLTSFSAGLWHLPPWARRIWRVRRWVHAKLLINAARVCCLRLRARA